jgi:transposase-like protein
LLRILGWARDGLTDEQIAHNMGITKTTLYDWVKRFPAISHSLKEGKAPVDQEVENALLKRAMGFTYEETTTDVEQIPTSMTDEDGNPILREIVHTKTVTKTALPDVTAQIFWLKNRRPDKWREKQDVQVNAEPVRIVIDV